MHEIVFWFRPMRYIPNWNNGFRMRKSFRIPSEEDYRLYNPRFPSEHFSKVRRKKTHMICALYLRNFRFKNEIDQFQSILIPDCVVRSGNAGHCPARNQRGIVVVRNQPLVFPEEQRVRCRHVQRDVRSLR